MVLKGKLLVGALGFGCLLWSASCISTSLAPAGVQFSRCVLTSTFRRIHMGGVRVFTLTAVDFNAPLCLLTPSLFLRV